MKILALFALLAFGSAQAQNVLNEAGRLAKWKRVDMPFHSADLNAREKKMVGKLVEACRWLDDIYWRQSDLSGLAVYKATHNPTVKELFSIMGSRFDLVDENHSFLDQTIMPPGRDLYPHDLTRAGIERYVQQHPEAKAALYSPYTVVTRNGAGLTAVPYHEQYKTFLEPMARALREASALTDDKAFAHFLKLRADALLTDDYYASDLAWLDLKNPKFDIIFAPYETYLDDLLGVKSSYGAAVLVRNEEESAKLTLYEKYIPALQDALPLDAPDRPTKAGHVTPMEVMDAPFRSGDLVHGYQPVADNLPNDPRIHQEKGTKKIFFKNFMDARVNFVILPIAKKLMQPDQANKASPEGCLAATVMHEISHDLGPAFSRVAGQKVEITEAMGPVFSGLEEAKADVTGMFGLAWLVDHDALPRNRLEEYYASYVASIFRTLRFGTGEAHGRAQMMEFNYLQEQGALIHAGGVYAIDYAKIRSALAGLTKELLTMEATGDRSRAEAWFAKYTRMPGDLKSSLARTSDIPVDIHPIFSFPDNVH